MAAAAVVVATAATIIFPGRREAEKEDPPVMACDGVAVVEVDLEFRCQL